MQRRLAGGDESCSSDWKRSTAWAASCGGRCIGRARRQDNPLPEDWRLGPGPVAPLTGVRVLVRTLTGVRVLVRTLTGVRVLVRTLTGVRVLVRALTGVRVLVRALTGVRVLVRALTGVRVLVRALTGVRVLVRALTGGRALLCATTATRWRRSSRPRFSAVFRDTRTAEVRLQALRTRIGLWMRKARGTHQKLSASGLRWTWQKPGSGCTASE